MPSKMASPDSAWSVPWQSSRIPRCR